MIRIGALSDCTGLSPDVLRAWERRYGLIMPKRTSGGFRLYDESDVAAVQRMANLIATGLSASEAAHEVVHTRAALAVNDRVAHEPALESVRRALHAALRTFDEERVERAIDRVLATVGLDTAIRDCFLPALAEIGDDWAAGTLSVAQEHFSVGVLRNRLVGLARGWDSGKGPLALLACPPDELHDVSLVMFGLALRERGWRVIFLGPSTPLKDLFATQEPVDPQITVLFSANWAAQRALVPALAASRPWPVALAGASAGPTATHTGCRWLEGDPVSVADEVTAQLSGGRRGRRGVKARS